MSKPVIFNYEDYRLFIKDTYKFCKEVDPKFSYREFAKRGSFKSPNAIKMIADGKRNVAPISYNRLAKSLTLNRTESEYLSALIRFNQEQNALERDKAFQIVQKLRKTSGPKLLKYEYFSKWYYIPIREMVNLRGFSEDPHWIQRKLRSSITLEEAAEAWAWLKKMGYVVKDEDNRWRQSDPMVTSGLYAPSYAITHYHEKMLKKSIEALWKIPARERDISSVTLSLKKEDIVKVIMKLIQVRRELLSTYDCSDANGDKIFQLNVQFFPISD